MEVLRLGAVSRSSGELDRSSTVPADWRGWPKKERTPEGTPTFSLLQASPAGHPRVPSTEQGREGAILVKAGTIVVRGPARELIPIHPEKEVSEALDINPRWRLSLHLEASNEGGVRLHDESTVELMSSPVRH